MRFKITLVPTSKIAIIPINYQYPLSAAIYKILDTADSEYATLLHEKGYQVGDGLKSFKLFTFSDLKMRFDRQRDRMHLRSDAELTVSFHLPEAAQHFVKGLFLSQNMDIADKKSKATFRVSTVEALPDPFNNTDSGTKVILDVVPISPCVVGLKNDKGSYEFLSPIDARFPLCLLHNWHQKLMAVGMTVAENELDIDIKRFKVEPKSRLVTIKAGTKAQTRIRGFVNFGVRMLGQQKYVEVLYNSGMGLYNAQGMGCVELMNNMEMLCSQN